MLTYVKRWKKGSNESNQPARDLKRFASQPEQREQGRSSGFRRDYSRLTCSAECPATSDDLPTPRIIVSPAKWSSTPLFDALRAEKSAQWDRRRSKGIVLATKTPLKHPRRTIPQRRRRCCFRGGIKGQFNHAACQTRREEAAATDAAGQKASAQTGSRRGRRPETHLLLHLWSSQICPLRARATLGETASINSLANYRSCHQVRPH